MTNSSLDEWEYEEPATEGPGWAVTHYEDV